MRQGDGGNEVVNPSQERNDLRPPGLALPMEEINDSRHENPGPEEPKQRNNNAP